MFLICAYPLEGKSFSQAPISLTFSDLTEAMLQWEKQKMLSPVLQEARDHPISIRGFLYYKESAGWVLAAEPNLKSCCLHSETHRPLIYLAGDASQFNSTQAITLHGSLSLRSTNPLSFQLADFSLQPADHTAFLLACLFGLVAIFCLSLLLKKMGFMK